MSPRLFLAIVFTLLFLPSRSHAEFIGFERIVDTQTRVPNASSNFNPGFNAATVGADVYFVGGYYSASSGYYSGLFRSRAGVIEKLADTNDVIPGSTGGQKFSVFDRVSVNDGRIIFAARDQDYQQSLYEIGSANSVVSLADNDATSRNLYEQAIPQADGSVRFQSPRLGNNVPQPGFYELANGFRTPLANSTTAIPGGTGNFLDSSFEGTIHSDIDRDGAVVFRGQGSSDQVGLYSDRGGSLDKVFDVNDAIPGTSSKFVDFLGAKLNDGIIGVITGTGPTDFGLFKIDQTNQLIRVVDNVTAHSETGKNFVEFGAFDFDKDIFLFEGMLAGDSTSSLFYDDGSGIKKFLGAGDQFDGRSIISVSNPQSIGNGEFLFSARSDGAQDSLYRVRFAPTAVPEPSAVAILFFGTILCVTRRRRSRAARTSVNTFVSPA